MRYLKRRLGRREGMFMEIKVSVIVPVYNAEKYIDRCMKGLLEQTYKDMEILLLAGIGSDNSLQKCLEWQKKDDRVILVSRRDRSLGDARNYGLRLARGRYIAYVDVDDIPDKNYLWEMIEPLEADRELDLTCCGYDHIRSDGGIEPGYNPPCSGKTECQFNTYLQLVDARAARVWTKVYRRKWLIDKGIEMYDGCCEDQAVRFMLAANVKHIFFIRKSLYHYNVDNADSLVHTLKGNADYGRSVAFAVEYLKSAGIFEQVRLTMKHYIVGEMLHILDKLKNHPQMLRSCKEFLELYYPEVVSDYYRYTASKKSVKESLILFGGGTEADHVLGRIDQKLVCFIVDNNEKLHGRTKGGIPIRSFQYLLSHENGNAAILITSYRYCHEMANQLWNNGIDGFWMARDYIREMLEHQEFNGE